MDAQNERSDKPVSKLKAALAAFLDCDAEEVQDEWRKLSATEKIALFRDLITNGTSVLWVTNLVWNAENEPNTEHLTEEQVNEIVRRMHEEEKA